MGRSLPITQAREKFPKLLQDAAIANRRTVVTSRGIEIGAIISISDLELLETLEDELDFHEAKQEAKKAKKQPKIAWSKLKKELSL